jgi:hypothetical protein
MSTFLLDGPAFQLPVLSIESCTTLRQRTEGYDDVAKAKRLNSDRYFRAEGLFQ